MTRKISLNTAKIRKFYAKFGINVERFISNVESFELVEGPYGLKEWQPKVTGDSEFYGELGQFPWYYKTDKPEFQLALPFTIDRNILEVGCGEGHFCRLSNFSSYVGIDLNPQAIIKGKQSGYDVCVDTIEGYARKHPKKFGIVCSFQVLEHLADPSIYFKSAHVLLASDGLLITSVPSDDSFVGYQIDNILNSPPHHLTRWSDSALREYPKQFGFECIELSHVLVDNCHYHWFWTLFIQDLFSPESLENKYELPSIITRIKSKIILLLLRAMGAKIKVSEYFKIPGHTVLAVYRKI